MNINKYERKSIGKGAGETVGKGSTTPAETFYLKGFWVIKVFEFSLKKQSLSVNGSPKSRLYLFLGY